MSESTSRKLLVGLDPNSGQPKPGKDFLVLGPNRSLVGLRSGTTFERGVVVFVGHSVTASDLVSRASPQVRPSVQEESTLARFLTELSALKIGSVVELSPDPTSSSLIRKAADHCAAPARRRLP